ncbi:MAG: dihydroorotate dehydrogenase electron transfer subunit [Candidatus Cloacimonadota bacterium]|nr:MAG: dihydroorotate dehydrogenase electron transfer subunit [Candidatus Cloacimonadota bacterium]
MTNIKDYPAIVISNKHIDDNIFLIELLLPGFDGKAEPGQFIMIKIDETYDPFLRRPYSIFECKKEKVKILIKTVGKGSKMIAEKKRKEEMDILGPLGNGFPVDKNNYPILVAGGMGIAPLWFLGRRLTKLRNKFSIIFGEKTTTPLAEEIKKTFGAKVFFVTDDGSRGIKLTASAALPLILDKSPYRKFSIYACGPKGMLKDVINFGSGRNIPVYVSLEEKMACGIGVCLGCSVKRRGTDGFLTVCRDGPVFKGEEVMI